MQRTASVVACDGLGSGRSVKALAVLGATLLGGIAPPAAGCGARTELDRAQARGSGSDQGAGGAASVGGAGGSGRDAGQGGIPSDAGPPDASLPLCRLADPGAPVAVHAYGDRDLHTPSAVVVSPGVLDAGTGMPVALARVALQAVSSASVSAAPDGIEVGQLEIAGEGPDAISVANPFFLLGDASMTYAQMVGAPGDDSNVLALTWSGDNGHEIGFVSTEPWGAASVSTILGAGASTPHVGQAPRARDRDESGRPTPGPRKRSRRCGA